MHVTVTTSTTKYTASSTFSRWFLVMRHLSQVEARHQKFTVQDVQIIITVQSRLLNGIQRR